MLVAWQEEESEEVTHSNALQPPINTEIVVSKLVPGSQVLKVTTAPAVGVSVYHTLPLELGLIFVQGFDMDNGCAFSLFDKTVNGVGLSGVVTT